MSRRDVVRRAAEGVRVASSSTQTNEGFRTLAPAHWVLSRLQDPRGLALPVFLHQAGRQGLEDQFEDIQVPTEEVTEVVRGSKKVRQHRHFPGYVLVKMEMTDQAFHLIKNTPKVTGFLGPNGKPQAISEAEAARILSTKEEMAAAAPSKKIQVDYDIGDSVKVLDGPFASFNGIVEELDFDRGRVKVSVSIFGRATPVELEFEQVERVK